MKPVNSRRKTAPSSAAPVATLIGQQLVNAGKLTEHDIPRIVAEQNFSKLRFGETAIGLGLATEADVQEMLARQYDYPICPLSTSNFNPALVVAHNPFGAQSEAFRTLRSQLTLRWLSDRTKS